MDQRAFPRYHHSNPRNLSKPHPQSTQNNRSKQKKHKMNAITITARRWSGGWELWNGNDIWTQVRTLAKARQQVIDYLDTMEEDIDHSTWNITIVPEIAQAAQVEQSAAASKLAEESARAASAASRKAVRALKDDNYSLADISYIMGLSRARVSQLANS